MTDKGKMVSITVSFLLYYSNIHGPWTMAAVFCFSKKLKEFLVVHLLHIDLRQKQRARNQKIEMLTLDILE